MLILTRRTDQKLVISHPDGDITVMLCAARKDRAQLGIAAPPSVTVRREELEAWTPKAASA